MNAISHKTARSIFTTQTISYLLVILVITATFSVFFFSTAKNHLEQEVGRKLQDIASIAAKNAPFERLELIKVGDDQTRMVLRLKEKLDEIREATGVQNIILFRPDKTSLLDLESDIPIGIRYELPRFHESFLKKLAGGKSVSTGSFRVPTGKFFISAYAPVLDSEGRLFAVVGINAGTREVEVIERMRTRLYLIAGLGIVLAFLLALWLARSLTLPIRSMAQTAQRIGRGDYDARVSLPSTAELRVLADSINTMAQHVKNRDAKLKEMSASVAHEIRNPLNSIKLLITLLEEELADQQGVVPSNSMETLHHEIGKLNRFLTEFLTYSRPIILTRDVVAPKDLAQAAVEMAMAEAEEKEVEIDLAAQDDLPTILVDRDRLEQSLLNLLLNAVQACDSGGKVDVKVHRLSKENEIEFIVEDSGSGIPEDVMKNLFEPFFTTRESGTGLGLSNTSKIVQSHGGSLYAESRVRGGARFTIRLPAQPAGSKEI